MNTNMTDAATDACIGALAKKRGITYETAANMVRHAIWESETGNATPEGEAILGRVHVSDFAATDAAARERVHTVVRSAAGNDPAKFDAAFQKLRADAIACAGQQRASRAPTSSNVPPLPRAKSPATKTPTTREPATVVPFRAKHASPWRATLDARGAQMFVSKDGGNDAA